MFQYSVTPTKILPGVSDVQGAVCLIEICWCGMESLTPSLSKCVGVYSCVLQISHVDGIAMEGFDFDVAKFES